MRLRQKNPCRGKQVVHHRAAAGMPEAVPRGGAFGLLASEKGTAATEYAVLTAIIAIGVLIAMGGFGDSLNGIYMAIASVAQSMV